MTLRSIVDLIPSFDDGDTVAEIAPPDALDTVLDPVDLPPIFTPKPRPPEIDVQAIYEDGRRAGLAEAEALMQQALAEAAANTAAQVDAARRTWALAEGQALAQQLDAAIGELQATICRHTADALSGFLAERARERAVAAMSETLKTIIRDGDGPAIIVEGPNDLVDALAKAVGTSSRLSLAVGGGPELKAMIGGTEIETTIGQWCARLRDAATDAK